MSERQCRRSGSRGKHPQRTRDLSRSPRFGRKKPKKIHTGKETPACMGGNFKGVRYLTTAKIREAIRDGMEAQRKITRHVYFGDKT